MTRSTHTSATHAWSGWWRGQPAAKVSGVTYFTNILFEGICALHLFNLPIHRKTRATRTNLEENMLAVCDNHPVEFYAKEFIFKILPV